MGYSIHGDDANIFTVESMEKLTKEADLSFFVATYKLTRLYNLVQLDIKMLLDIGILENVEDVDSYPYSDMKNSIKFIGDYLRYKLGDEVVDEWDNLIDDGLNDDEIKLGALVVLLEATSDYDSAEVEVEAQTLHKLIKYVKQIENNFR